MKKILVVAVHPDDETLGAGGTLLKHKENGDEIFWLICTEINKKLGYSKEKIISRKKEIDEVTLLFEIDKVAHLGLPTTQIDQFSMSELTKKISEVINEFQPNIIYLPFKSDVHSDHRIIFDAVYSCTKSFRYPFIKRILMMETLSETEFSPSTKEDCFIPNVYVDISKFIEKKIEIMKVYEGEIFEHPFPRSERNIKALGTFRGAAAGCDYAESFMLLKEIL